MNIMQMHAKCEDLRLKAAAIIELAQKEDRFLTDAEEAQMNAFLNELGRWKRMIDQAAEFEPDERSAAPVTEPVKPSPQNEGRFASFGEQLMAIYRAAAPDARLDSRLSTRASGANETVQADGGFLVQTDFVSTLLQRTYETGILASRVQRIPVSSGSNGIKINAIDESSRANGSRWGGVQAYWMDEAEQLVASRPKFREMTLSLKKLTGLCYTTDELLQDASALESVITQSFSEEFGFKIDDAIYRGTGAGQPLGVLNSGALVKVPTVGQTEMITVENIVNMWARMWGRSRANAVWYVNQEIEPHLYTLKVGDQPVYIPAGGLSASPYATILGRPVVPLEQCSQIGHVGDILFADLSQYLLIDKGGMNSAYSIHVRFLYDEGVFRFIYRADGQPTWNKPLTPYKGANTISPFVALDARN